MVKRSIEQEIRNKNFGARSGNFEKNAVVKNPGTKQRVQRILGDCWQWEANGQCVRGFPFLHGSRAGYPGIWVLIYSWYCGIGILSGNGICSRR